MIITNPVVRLDYDPTTDILSVDWPDFTEYSVSEAEYILDAIIDTVITYNIAYLLTDTRNGVVNIPDSKYREIGYSFASKLAKTRVKKIARLVTEVTTREQPIKEITQKAQFSVPIRNFFTEQEALAWLKEK